MLPIPAAFLQYKCLQTLHIHWKEKRSQALVSMLNFTTNCCVPELLSTLPLLAVSGIDSSAFSALTYICKSQSFPGFGLIWVLGCGGVLGQVLLSSSTRMKAVTLHLKVVVPDITDRKHW